MEDICDDKVKLTYINLPVNFQYMVASKVYMKLGTTIRFSTIWVKGIIKYYDLCLLRATAN
jgi:hypothetical protein